jgi:hypothetical protein
LTALPTASLDLPLGVPRFLHHFEPEPDARHLVIAFTGLATDPGKPRSGWPQRVRLSRLPVHRLYVESQVRPLPDPCLDLAALNRFVAAAREQVGVPAARTITCGSSLGATAAVDVALRQGFAHAVAGSPIVLIGDYVKDDFIPAVVRSSIRASFAQTPDDQLNDVITDAVHAAPGPTAIDFFVGDEDHFYPEHSEALALACAGRPGVVDLRLTVEPGITHQTMYRAWSRHLALSMRALLGTAAGDDVAEGVR